MVLVDRNRGSAGGVDRPPGVELDEVLGAGESLILFPEGTRNTAPDEGLLPFKAGLYHLALKFPGVEPVPVHLANLSRILPKGEMLPVPLLARVVFGRPMRPEPGEAKEAYLERARAALMHLAEGEDG